ncbi:protein kinase domain-containing protein [Acetobacter persici]|uniref:Protein kinase domain-containing protein n=1 Tax=Acetobacter persici TaxID=1076596 RepID=A0A6V8IBV4_9PROT|nr:serine/threonine protein kinase [Acetobacter persici]OUI91007.1 serine/threonine protein kinase [Acetobacter persici]GFE94714.1 hypothetical protein DmAi_27730 [Acetobacter persici]
MSKLDKAPSSKLLSDEYGNQHCLVDELARGGQGVVFRTKDADLAIKQALKNDQPDKSANLRERFQNIRLLPIPARIPVALPLAILRDEPGYVMRLLSDMKPFSIFELNGKMKKELDERSVELPEWLAATKDRNMALLLLHYVDTGSTRRRLFAVAKCAAILARLHGAGLVYGDISTNNAFVSMSSVSDVWLIDADNMRLERSSGGISVYTPGYGAPELVQERDQSRPRTDCWAFAVMVFKLLALCHPFIGKKVEEPDNEEEGWDTDADVNEMSMSLDEQAFAGYLPFIDDEDDNSNSGTSGLPRALVTTSELRRLFQETFAVGREHPHRRPTMVFWALELMKAADHALDCPECGMSYFAEDHEKCLYCDSERPAFIRIQTPRWKILIPACTTEFHLPHRLFYPFSLEHYDDIEYESVLNFADKTAVPVRGTKSFPENLMFRFVASRK